MAHPGRAIRCVIWNPSGPELPTPLAAALEKQSVESVQTPDAVIAFAEVLGLHAEQGSQPVLVIVEPMPAGEGPARTLGELLEAMDAYQSKTPVWVFNPAASPKLAALSSEDRLRWTTPEVTIPLRSGGLRLVGDRAEGAVEHVSEPVMEPVVEPDIEHNDQPLIEPKPERASESSSEQSDKPSSDQPAEQSDDPAGDDPAGLLTQDEIDVLMGHADRSSGTPDKGGNGRRRRER